MEKVEEDASGASGKKWVSRTVVAIILPNGSSFFAGIAGGYADSAILWCRHPAARKRVRQPGRLHHERGLATDARPARRACE
jgi:hypothetical protein